MLKIAVYSLTRDRLEYTQDCFKKLKEKAGITYDHYIVDNGSQDGTVEWLKENEFKKVIYNSENLGISKASNQALEEIFKENYDLVIKMDNDCEIESENILKIISDIYESFGKYSARYILSPYVNGINNQPTRGGKDGANGYTIGLTSIVGGLFHIVPADIYKEYRYDETLPLAKYQDDFFCKWFKENGGKVGYIEELKVWHKDTTTGQCEKYPDYFARKWNEEIKN
jgi:GT2 family glycosyltransferase